MNNTDQLVAEAESGLWYPPDPCNLVAPSIREHNRAIIQAAIEKATESADRHAAFAVKIANERLEEIARLKFSTAHASELSHDEIWDKLHGVKPAQASEPKQVSGRIWPLGHEKPKPVKGTAHANECKINSVLSRVCERGTKCCEVHHGKPTEEQARLEARGRVYFPPATASEEADNKAMRIVSEQQRKPDSASAGKRPNESDYREIGRHYRELFEEVRQIVKPLTPTDASKKEILDTIRKLVAATPSGGGEWTVSNPTPHGFYVMRGNYKIALVEDKAVAKSIADAHNQSLQPRDK